MAPYLYFPIGSDVRTSPWPKGYPSVTPRNPSIARVVLTQPPPASNGGVAATDFQALFPVYDQRRSIGYVAYFDPTNFNDAAADSALSFRVEDIAVERVPTVRRVVITYRDMGVATLTATVTAVNDQLAVVTDSKTNQIGTTGATMKLMTAFFDLQVTGFRPQLSLSRPANGGPVSISTVTMVGMVEQVTL